MQLPVEVQIRGRLSSKGHARELPRSTKTGCPRCGVWGSCTDTSAIPGRFRSPSVAKHGFAIAGSSRQFEGSSWFGLARSKPQAGVPSGGFCAPLRRGDARVDGVATEGTCKRRLWLGISWSGKDFQSLDQSSGRVAGDPRTGCSDAICRQFRRRARVAGSSSRGAVCPILSVHSRVDAKYGLRKVRIGEAAHPGPDSRRRRAQRLRPLPWSWDSDTESDEEGRQVVRRVEAQSIDTDPLIAQSSPPSDRFVQQPTRVEASRVGSPVP